MRVARAKLLPSSVQAAVLRALAGGCVLECDPGAGTARHLRLLLDEREQLLGEADGVTVSTGTYWSLRTYDWIRQRGARSGARARYELSPAGAEALQRYDDAQRARREGAP